MGNVKLLKRARVSAEAVEEMRQAQKDLEFASSIASDIGKANPSSWLAVFEERVVAIDPDRRVLAQKLEQEGVPPHRALILRLTGDDEVWIFNVHDSR